MPEQVVELAGKWGDRGWLNADEFGLGQAYFIAGHYLKADEMLARASAQLMSPKAIAPMGTTVDYMLLMCCMVNSVVNTNLGNRDNADRLRRLAARYQLEKETSLARHAQAITQALYPEGHLQERAVAGIYFLASQGPQLLDTLVAAASDSCPGHKMLPL